jgi:UDPglucose--hexose-1-phosphate uridylyltransferase
MQPGGEPVVGVVEPLFKSERVVGTCRVVCFSPRHDLTLAQMDHDSIRGVVDVWAEQTEELGKTYRWVQLFENCGSAMGASSPHPHGQIWAGSAVPVEIEAEDDSQRRYLEKHGRSLLVDYTEQEATRGERVVVENDSWMAVVPYWAVWPFETLVMPRRPVGRLEELSSADRSDLAQVMSELLVRYDNLFEYPFPYSMGWHGAPYGGESSDHWQLHAHFYPPLLRSASIRKFMVGYELLAEPQRDLTAEEAARLLRSLPDTHYLDRENVD